MIYLVNLLKSN